MSEKSVGFNYPPLHPRCRSTVAPYIEGSGRLGTRVARVNGKRLHVSESMKYEEFKAKYLTKTAENNKLNEIPRFEVVDYDSAAKVRTAEQVSKRCSELKPVIESQTGLQSKWSGRITLGKGSRKEWDCSITLEADAPDHVLIHELIHSCSASYVDRSTFAKNRIAEMEGLAVVESAYDGGVELIREFQKVLKIEKTDLEFAVELIRQPLIERFDYLENLINETLGLTATVEEYELIYKKLEAIKSWKES